MKKRSEITGLKQQHKREIRKQILLMESTTVDNEENASKIPPLIKRIYQEKDEIIISSKYYKLKDTAEWLNSRHIVCYNCCLHYTLAFIEDK